MLAEVPTARFAAGAVVDAPALAPSGDQCRSGELTWLIGKAKAKIPAPRDGETRRITCTQCTVTMDYVPARLNILYDKKTGIIRKLKCG
jgi:hypothetical protein